MKKFIFTIALTVTALTAFASNNQTAVKNSTTPIIGKTTTVAVNQTKNNLIYTLASQTTLSQSGPRIVVGSCVSGCLDGL